MKRLILLFTLCLASPSLFGQTKTIAYKRYATNNSTIKKNTFHSDKKWDTDGGFGGTSNFGVAPERWVRNSELKKVIFVNDTTTVMVTEETCRNEFSYQQQETEKWRAGSDTVLRHPVFTASISVDSMRSILEATYYFANDMRRVAFEGFEKRTSTAEKPSRREKLKEQITAIEEKKKSKSSGTKYTILAILLASSIGIGVIKLR